MRAALSLPRSALYSSNPPRAPANARAWDHIWRAGVGVSWFINRHLYLNASYDFETLDTNVPNDGYDVNRVWLTLGLER